MRSHIRWAAAAALLAALSLSGCAEVSEAKHETVEPYTKEEIGDGLYRVTLTASAADRLDIDTAPVKEARATGGAIRKVIPYGAIIYDINGDTWTYTSPQSLLYLRARISVDYIDGNNVFLLEGPKAGTPVVVTGAAELYGIEFGLGK